MKELLTQFAQKINPGDINIPTNDAGDILANGLNITYFVGGVIAVIVIIVAGIMYATSGGDSGNVTKAKNMILYSVIGLIVILIAFVITQFVIGRF
jgi:hypothetical protein